MNSIRGIFTPNIVLLNEDHSINEDELRRLTAWLIDGNAGGFSRLL
jgi:dihydrodipicolinate synthase/N-acetylneuraminate lyase